MRLTLVLLVALTIDSDLTAQPFVRAEINYGSYGMKTMKEFQQDLLASARQTSLPLFVVNSFPAYFGYGLSGGMSWGRVTVGASLGYCSTGGRLHYEDYSGYLLDDQLLRSFTGATFFQYKLNKSERWSVLSQISTGTALTQLNETSTTSIGGNTTTYKRDAQSTNYLIKPGLIFRYAVGRYFIDLGVAYEVQLHGKLHEVGKSTAFLSSTGRDMYAEWDGIRLSSGFGFLLKKQK